MPVILALERLRQKDGEFEACLGYTASSKQPVLDNEILSQNKNKISTNTKI
jgi:hypothetical protein